MLAALATRPGEVVSAEKLIDDIWPGVEDQVARRRLHTAVWKLRGMLGKSTDDRPLIRWSALGYVLDAAVMQLDWTRFRRLRLAGEGALRRGAPNLAASYLSAALSLWRGSEPLSGVDVVADDMGFVSEQCAQRASAKRGLVAARFELGRHGELIQELSSYVVEDPLDSVAAGQLAVCHYRSGNPTQALAVCRRYMELAERSGIVPSRLIADLQAAILRSDPDVASALTGSVPRVVGPGPVRRAFLSCAWSPHVPSPTSPLPAEVLLLLEESGGQISDASDSSVDAWFGETVSALTAAVELQRAMIPPRARVGIFVQLPETSGEAFDGTPRARARLLASAARDGQMLVSGSDARDLKQHLPPEARLRALGRHRLNAITPPASVFQLVAQSVPAVGAAPRWFDRGGVHNLAEDPFRLIGREREIADVTARLEQTRLVTLTGAPGSGKTRLATHVGARVANEYPDGVWFAGLDVVSQPGFVAAAVADVVTGSRPGALPPLDTILRHLSTKRALLVLDNCEHVLSECRDLVERLLPACSDVTVLATSREALRSRFEHVVTVPPLEPPPHGPHTAVLANPAVQLFYDRLGQSRTSDAVGADRGESESVARICRAVEGIPLALVLAAARAREVGVAALAELVEETLGEGKGLRVLSGEDAMAPVSRETLRGTLEWSYGRLEENERLVFDSLAVFRGGFALEDVAAVNADASLSRGDVLAALERLVQVSMVVAADRAGRFRLLQPVRDFASAKLAARGRAAAEIRRAHAEHFLALAERAERHLRGRQDRATLDRLEGSLPDLYAAIRWAIDARNTRLALRIAGSLWVFWLVRGRIDEGRHLVEAALGADATLSRERIKALTACAHLSWFGGDVHRTLEACKETVALAEAFNDDWGWAWGALGHAAVGMFDGRDQWVPLRIEEILPRFRALGNDWDTGQALQALGGAVWHRAQYERGEEVFSETVELYRSLGHPTLMASLRDHGLMLALLGRPEQGAAEIDHSIERAYEAGDLTGLAQGLCRRGAVARYAGQHDHARRCYRQALSIAREAGEAWAMQWALDGLADTEQLGLGVPSERLETCVQILARAGVMARETGITLAPRELECHDQDLETCRARLGDRVFAAAFARGEALGLQEAVDLALAQPAG